MKKYIVKIYPLPYEYPVEAENKDWAVAKALFSDGGSIDEILKIEVQRYKPKKNQPHRIKITKKSVHIW